MLKDYHVMFDKLCLFGINIDVEVRISRIKINGGNTLHGLRRFKHRIIHFRPVRSRMCKKNQYLGQGNPRSSK